PERINRRPDIPRRFAEHLQHVRTEIHGPEQESGDTPRLQMRQIIDLRNASDAEATLASLLLTAAYPRG
ncbi:HNH endonuclease, partial [Gordonia rubripertincta]|nr:HNH endonuclease [Gordonia rubripertincta]